MNIALFTNVSIILPAQADVLSYWPILVVILLLAVVVLAALFPYWVILHAPLWLVCRLFYRIRAIGPENAPKSGPALLVANHVSHIDAMLIQACLRRRVRFLIWEEWLNIFWLKPFLKLARVIPIKANGGPRSIIRSLRNASEALANGEIVCIFAEGGITRTGFLLSFQRGLEQVVKNQPAPIIPIYLDHVWGSIYSFRGGRFFWKWPRHFPYPVSAIFGDPLPAETPAYKVRQQIQLLSAESAVRRSKERVPVHRQFVRTAARHPFRSCFIDPTNDKKPVMNYGEALAGAKILANHLRPRLQDEEMIGLWIPPSPGGALTNIAISFLGKVPVNLNYSASVSVVQSTIRQCNIRTVLTSKLFAHKVTLEPGPNVKMIYLEDFRTEIGKGERLRAFLSVLLVPGFLQERWILGLGKHTSEDLATIIFSSGSTGEPKGVMLTHGNIAANAESMIQAIDPSQKDRLLSILPFFHSFGYSVALWLPLQVGASAVFYPNPLAAKEIGAACKKFQATLFISTPTFLRSYLKRCQPDDFASLRILICGAEKLPQPLAEEFREKFGILPLEGYGCTELSPVAATNVPDWETEGYKQIGNKPGTIGRPLPGIAARIVDPSTKEEKPVDEEGMLMIYGANVMKGYLNRPELTEEKLDNGWYITGDLGKIDADGFITITGRVERFAKVGGEMVPLEKVEEEIHNVLETNERICAVTAIPDEKRGERIVVLYMAFNCQKVETIRKELSSRGLPNIYIPGQRDFFEVEELPILGSGKLDIKKCKEKAMQLAAE